MSNPIVTEDIGGYTLAWTEEQIKITVTNVQIHSSDGRVTGVLKIETTAPGYKPILHAPSQFNFMATRSRDELAKRVSTRFNHTDWYLILEQTANEVVRRQMAGEPVYDLDVADDVSPPKIVLSPVLYQGMPTIVFGDRGSAKSTLALLWGQIVELPWHDNPLGIDAPADIHRVLYLDWELNREGVLWQLKKLVNGMIPNPSVPKYRRCYIPLADDLERLRHWVTETRCDILIIDSLGPACGGDLNDAGQALRFFGALSQLRVTPLILAHTAKNNETGKRSVFGSSFFENEARNIWEVKALQEAGDETLEVGLFHRKSLPFMGKQKPFGYKFTYTETTTVAEPHNPEYVREFHTALGSQKQIEQYLIDEGKKTIGQIAESLGLTQAAVQQALKRMRSKNTATCIKTESGWQWYALTKQDIKHG